MSLESHGLSAVKFYGTGETPLGLRVLTLNCWGLPLISKDRLLRMRAIGRQLAEMELDLVGLQEMWMEADRETLLAEAKSAGLQYAYYFRSGIMGSGLLTLSRFPFDAIRFLRFRLNGKPENVRHGDYYGAKGIGMVRVSTPAGPVDFYNTHTIAQYAPDEHDEYFAHRVAQMYEIAYFMERESAGTPPYRRR